MFNVIKRSVLNISRLRIYLQKCTYEACFRARSSQQLNMKTKRTFGLSSAFLKKWSFQPTNSTRGFVTKAGLVKATITKELTDDKSGIFGADDKDGNNRKTNNTYDQSFYTIEVMENENFRNTRFHNWILTLPLWCGCIGVHAFPEGDNDKEGHTCAIDRRDILQLFTLYASCLAVFQGSVHFWSQGLVHRTTQSSLARSFAGLQKFRTL